MPSRCVRRRAFRVRIFQVHKLERIFITEAMTQVGSWNKLFNDIGTVQFIITLFVYPSLKKYVSLCKMLQFTYKVGFTLNFDLTFRLHISA